MNRAGLPATSRTTFWIALFLFVATLSLCTPNLHAQSASVLYKRGQAAEAREDYDGAYDNFQKALAKAPKDLRIRTAYLRVRVSASAAHMTKGRSLMQQGDDQGALGEFLHAAEIDPGNEAATQEIGRVRAHQGEIAPRAPNMTPEQASQQDEIESMGAPVQLKPVSNEPLTLHMAEDAKTVYQAIGRAAGVNVLFDPDYTSKRVQVDLTNVSLSDALRIVGTMSNTFWRPVTTNTIFVAQNTRAKRTELDEQAVQTFYLTNAWQQNDLNDVQTALRNVLTNIKVYGVASQNALVVRGTPDELQLAQKLIYDLDKARPEVVVDIAIMEVSKNWERTLGLQWPSSASVALQSSTAATTTTPTTGTTSTTSTTSTSTPTIYSLAHLNSNNFAVTVGAVTANLLLTDSNTKVLQNPRLRSTDSQKATMKIGERIPVATGSYQTGASTALVSSLVNTQFQYLDIGVNIEMTPTIHYDGDVTLKMKIEDSSEGSPVSISGITEPIIIQKTSEQVIRLREGEVSILGGILEQQDSTSWSGIPGLSSIPILKYLFGSKDHTITDDELVFMLIPHVVRSQNLTAANLRPIDTGSGTAVELRHLPTDGPAAHAAPVVHSAVSESITGTYPGQTAAGAVPAALADLRTAAQGSGNAKPVPQPNLGPSAATPTPPDTAPTNPASPASAPPATAPPAAPLPPAIPGSGVTFMMNPPPAVAVGASFQVPIVVSGAKDLSAIPLQVQYDASKLTLVNVDLGDFLSRDGQAVSPLHRDDGPGLITLNASRPPGAAGVNGAGVVFMLTFQAASSGNSTIAITRPGAVNSANQPVAAHGTQINVQVK